MYWHGVLGELVSRRLRDGGDAIPSRSEDLHGSALASAFTALCAVALCMLSIHRVPHRGPAILRLVGVVASLLSGASAIATYATWLSKLLQGEAALERENATGAVFLLAGVSLAASAALEIGESAPTSPRYDGPFCIPDQADLARVASRHRCRTRLVVSLLLAGAPLNCAAFLLSSYITTTRLAPFFDDQLVQDAGGADVFKRQDWRVTTRVGALKICQTIVAPPQWASPEKRFGLRTDSLVVTRFHGEAQPFPSVCGALRTGEALEAALVNVLNSVCAFPGLLMVMLPVLAGLTSILPSAAAATTFLSIPSHEKKLHAILCAGATLSALLALGTYLAWTTVLAAGLDLHLALSAQLTAVALSVFVFATVVAMARLRAETVEQELRRPEGTACGAQAA